MGVADADEVETFSQTIPEGGQGDDSNALDSDASGQATANDGRSPADSPDVSRDALADSVPAPNEANIADAMPADSNTDAKVADAMPAGNDANVADATSRDAGSQDASDASQCTPIISGLLGHWTMDIASMIGTRLADSSGNHNDGTLVGFSQSPTAPGRFGEALAYPASGTAYVHVPVLPLNQAGGGMNTVSMWFYRSGNNISDVLAFLPSPRYDLWLTGGTGKYLCINTAQGECLGVQDANLRDRWVHVVAILANGPTAMGSLYVDGQNRNAACLTNSGFSPCGQSATAATPVDFGGPGFPFHGMLDEVRLYNRALTASEVLALYTGTACP